jgi:predicted amidohydrolase
MRIGIFLSYAGGFAETVVELADFERAGADIVFVPEAWATSPSAWPSSARPA